MRSNSTCSPKKNGCLLGALELAWDANNGAPLKAAIYARGSSSPVLELKATDLECLDRITGHGPLSPSALARRAGLHPATLTGILDRLERGGWIERGRDPADRRGVTVQAARGRGAEILRLYLVESGMNTAVDQICARYEDEDLQLLTGFLRQTADAARTAAERLTTR